MSKGRTSETKDTHAFQLDPFGSLGQNAKETTITDENGREIVSAVGWTAEAAEKAASDKLDAHDKR